MSLYFLNFKSFQILIIIILGSQTLHASEQDKVIDELQKVSVAGTIAYDLVASLTAEVGPRMAGSKGDLAGVIWAEKKLKTLHFDRVWTEAVMIQPWIRGHESLSIISPFQPIGLKVVALGRSVPTPKDGIKAEVVHFKNFAALKNASHEQLAGKIAFVSYRMIRTRDGHGYSPASKIRKFGAVEAAKKGAVAIIIRSVGTDNNRLPHTGSLYYQDGVKAIPAAAISNPDADLLERRFASGETVRLKLNLQSHLGAAVKTANVLAEITGRERPEEIILLVAHLDSWDLGTGAVDDGAGIAIVTAAADLIAQLPARPKRSIRVALFAGEEIGQLGAKAYVKRHAKIIKNHIVGLESDFGSGKIWQLETNVSQAGLSVVKEIVKQLKPLGIALGGNETRGGPDLRPFYQLHMPVMELMQDGTGYFDIHHSANDTLDKITAKDLDQNVAAYSILAYILANSDISLRK